MNKHHCPCCNFCTLEGRLGGFDICPVCYWEDDAVQNDDPDYKGGANGISLGEAQENYKKIGAISSKYCDKVRPPLDEEK